MIYYYTKADKVYMNPDSSYMFLKLKRLGSINVDFDTSKVTNMRGMFQNDISLNSLDLSDWNTSRVTNMQEVFQMNTGLVELDLSNWDASNVTNMGRIFDNCVNLRTIYVKT
jgi:surface protein